MLPVVFLSLALATLAAAKGHVLVVHDNINSQNDYTILWSKLSTRGFHLHHVEAKNPSLSLTRQGEPYNHIIHMAPKSKKWGQDIKVTELLDFVVKGGNMLLIASPDVSEPTRDLAAQFGAEFDYPDTFVIDHFHYDRSTKLDANDDHTRIVLEADDLDENAKLIVSSIKAPVLYRGLGHATTKNPLAIRVLHADETAYSFEKGSATGKVKPVDEDPVISGRDISLVTVMQTLNNARIAVIGSLDMFSDNFLDAEIAPAEGTVNKSGNEAFADELVQWVFQEKAVLRVDNVRHFHTATLTQPSFYRVKDNISFELDVSELRHGKWIPFTVGDAQLEFVMMDPFIRTALIPRSSLVDSTRKTLGVDFVAPDRHGMFKFRVDYKRRGVSFLHIEDVVSVRPFRHDEYPRYITAAWPYYATSWSVMIGWLAFCALWLWSKPIQQKQHAE